MQPSRWITWDELRESRERRDTEERLFHGRFGPLPEPVFRCELIVAPGASRFVIYDIADLNAARALLREAFGSWTDELKMRFYSGCAITTWESKEGHPVALWLQCSVDDYPAELQSDKCKWAESGEREPSYDFICEV